MSPPVTTLPAYVGLFAALLLAVASNAYLDIGYGHFGTEIVLWAGVFACTLRIAWKQGGKMSANGLRWQKTFVVLGVLATFLLFIPIWGLPRAGLYLLAALQAAVNCVTVDRRKFMMALTTSAVMVMFSTAHFRADWTMMFYLLPYLVAVVLTLVAEQVSRRIREVRQEGLGPHLAGGQGMSIVAATATLLAVATVLLVVTPQVSRPYLMWKYGQISNMGIFNAREKGAEGGTLEQGGSGDSSSGSPGDQDFAHGAPGQSVGEGYRESMGRTPSWPTAKEMRAAAKRPGMPVWQATTMEMIATAMERIELVSQPLREQARAAAERAAKWLENHRQDLLRAVILLILLALLAAAAMLLREARPWLWLRMQFDFLRFGVFGLHASGNAAARQYFGAMERLFALHHVERDAQLNARDYLARLHWMHQPLRNETSEMVDLFEKARYSEATISADELARMRHLYRSIYQAV